jgi:predicted nucleotidyltransferase
MNFGLEESHLREIRQIIGEFLSIESGILFGSRAMGTFSPSSDVDIAITGEDVCLKDQIRLSARLNENRALLKYDVVRYCTITNKKLIDHILKYGVKIYERQKGAA